MLPPHAPSGETVRVGVGVDTTELVVEDGQVVSIVTVVPCAAALRMFLM